MRVYLPTTLAGLARLRRDGALPASAERYVADGDAEDAEYAALMAAAADAAALLGGPGRRVVVVAEVADPDGVVPLSDVVAVHADPEDRPAGADPDEDLGWYATQEIDALLGPTRGTSVGGMDAITFPPAPTNEPNLTYAPGSPEREALRVEIEKLERREKDLKAHIGGRRKAGGGAEMTVVQPHDHQHVLGRFKAATQADARAAIKAAGDAAPGWRALDMDERCAVLLRAAELLAGPWRQRINAATMLGQSKTAFQAEIDAACELIDFWRFNVHYAKQILTDQPIANSPGIWNRTDHRPLEGFVYAITPFNFTAIAGNLPTAPVLMGNTVIWKPAPTQQLAASLTMELLEEAGLPPGVINMLPGHGIPVSEVALAHPDLAGIHFTGSTPTFHHLWRTIGENISTYRSYPRIVGETGGKDFVLAHPSADPDVVRTALIRGAFEFQGQKCSAASRAYVAKSVWNKMKDSFLAEVESIPMGDVTDFSQLHGRGHRRPGLRQAQGRDRPRQAPGQARRGGRRPDRRQGRLVRAARPSSSLDRPDRRDVHAPSTSDRSWSCTSTTTATSRRSPASWRASRRTP